LPAQSFAGGNFEVLPIRLFITGDAQMSSFKVTNNSDEKLTIQMSSVSWTQDENGKDVYEPTKELLFFPKMVTVDSKKEVVIRIGLKSKEKIDTEKTFRLYVREIPVINPGELPQLQMALNVGVPVFFQPAERKEDAILEKLELADGKVLLTLKNRGNNHLLIKRIYLTGFNSANEETFTSEDKGWYVLNGKSGNFSTNIPFEGCTETDSIKVEVTMSRATIKLEGKLDLDKAYCPKEPVKKITPSEGNLESE
jgi:fimbrial chaperone protein